MQHMLTDISQLPLGIEQAATTFKTFGRLRCVAAGTMIGTRRTRSDFVLFYFVSCDPHISSTFAAAFLHVRNVWVCITHLVWMPLCQRAKNMNVLQYIFHTNPTIRHAFAVTSAAQRLNALYSPPRPW